MIYKYDAFISYSRNDKIIAQKLQKTLENKFSYLHSKYRVGKPRVMVALDSEDLEASEDLSNEIKKKINTSKHLIVINSKSSNNSNWVKKEVTYFRESRVNDNERKIITILYDLPDNLSDYNYPDELLNNNKEPLALDLRTNSISNSKLSFKKYFERKIILQIYSIFLNIGYSDLINRHEKHRQRLRKKRLFAFFSILTIVVVSFLIAIVQGRKANFEISSEVYNPLFLNTFSPAIVLKNDKSIIKGTDEGYIYIIDSLGKVTDSLFYLPGFIKKLELYNDKNLVGLSIDSDSLKIWDITKNKLIKVISNPDSIPLSSFAYSTKTNIVAFGDDEGNFNIEKDDKIISIKSINEDWGRIQDIKFFQNQEKIVYCFLDGPIGIFDLKQMNYEIIEIDPILNIEMLHSVGEVNGRVFLCAWGTSLSNNVFLKQNLEKKFYQIFSANSFLDEIHRIKGTDKILIYDWDGNIRLFDDENELTSISISDKKNYIENTLFTIDYNDEINTICAFTNNKIYYINIVWSTIFGIKSSYLKYI